MRQAWFWCAFFWNVLLCALFVCAAVNAKLSIYLIAQAKGQLLVLANTVSKDKFIQTHQLSSHQLANLKLVEEIKQFSVKNLGYKPSSSYNNVLDQKVGTTLWVITASKPYAMEAYEWNFPLLGKLSYKGYFDKALAIAELSNLKAKMFDVELSPVSAWSTLGWTKDPILSNTLNYSTGSFCELIFHELFHSTFYASNQLNLNENLANFIAHKATMVFLKNDTLNLNTYLREHADRKTVSKYMLAQRTYLSDYYQKIESKPNRYILKHAAIRKIVSGMKHLPLYNPKKFKKSESAILLSKNAYFVGFTQYQSLQDSLEFVFNKIYRGNIKNMVCDLKQI